MQLDEAIQKLKEKNEEAFELIYHQTKSMVFAVIIAIVKDQQLTEDLMQDTYITMIEAINSYNAKYNFKSWLGTIARNKALDLYRKRKREMLIDIHESEYLFPVTESDEDNKYNANYLLSFLSDEEKEIVMLHAVDNFKHREIAEIVNKPIGTVTWLYNSAIKKMQEAGKGIRL